MLAGCGGSRSSSGSIPVGAPPTRTVTYDVPSGSMEPTLHCARPGTMCEAAVSDGVVTEEPASSVKRGDLIVFHTPPLARVRCGAGGTFIKRVLGMPGDRWEERLGYVFIDGKKLDEPYVPSSERDARTVAPVTVPAGAYFVLGDNRSASCDSRAWGTVPRADVIGKVVQIVRPK